MLTDKEMAFHSEMRHLCDVAGGSLMVMASWWPLAVASAVSHGVEQSHDGQRKRNTRGYPRPVLRSLAAAAGSIGS